MTRNLLGLAAAFVLAATGGADVLIPPGYQGVVQVTDDTAFNRRPAMNNHGQFVFAKRPNPDDPKTSEIFLYDNGQLTRLTDDAVRDDFPDINDAGEIVWSRGIGPGGTLEIVLWRDGKLTPLTQDALDDSSPVINNAGYVAWSKFTETGCAKSDADIYVYDGQAIYPVTEGGYSNQSACLNDLGDLTWTRYDWCYSPWRSQIMVRLGTTISALTDDQNEVQGSRINNDRRVAWHAAEAPDWEHHIHLWHDGITSLLTDWGGGLRMNNRGDLVFNRWHDDSSTWQVWLYRDGKFWQMTDEPFWSCDADIDDVGNIAWEAGDPFDVDIKLLERLPLGDMNCDGVVNAFDIDPFVLALVDAPAYETAFPDCDRALADINLDSQADAFDIGPFVDILTH